MKNILNKVSTFGVVAAVSALVVLSNPLKDVELNKAAAGYGSSPVIPTIKDDCRVNGNCTTNNNNTNTENTKPENEVKPNENTKPSDETTATKTVEKEINGKKYSYMDGSNALVTRLLSDMSDHKTKFTDIEKSSAKEDIARLEKAGVVKGTTPTTYEPNRAITRAEFLAIVMGAYGYDLSAPAKKLPFGDVNASSWQAKVISAALEKNIIAGDVNAKGEKVFRPNSQISKVEALAIVYKVSGFKVENAAAHNFTDAAAEWQNGLLNNALHLELVSVPADKKFNPNAGISRADMANLVIKFAKLY